MDKFGNDVLGNSKKIKREVASGKMGKKIKKNSPCSCGEEICLGAPGNPCLRCSKRATKK